MELMDLNMNSGPTEDYRIIFASYRGIPGGLYLNLCPEAPLVQPQNR